MIKEYYSKPNLVPPFSFFVYVYWIFWKLKDMYQQSKKVSPTKNKNVSTNKNELNENEVRVSPRKQNLISNWKNRLNFNG